MNKLILYFLRLLASSIRIFFLRIRGAQIGKRVLIGRATFRTNPKNIVVGDGVVIGDGVVFDKLKSIEIKDYVKIHDKVHVENGTDGDATFSISNNSWIGGETILNCERNVTIETNVGIGCRSQLWTHGYFPSTADGYPSKFGSVTIKKGAWLPPSCIILPDVVIGEYSIIGTGSVVTKNIPDRVFATGIPCLVKAEENAYRKTVTPREKIKLVLEGCAKNIQQKGGSIKQLDENTWQCSFLFKRFEFSFQEKFEDWNKQKGDSCIFVWAPPKMLNQIPKNVSLFILSSNSYTKQATLHEWIIIRALLDSCTLRLMPIQA
ncbi:hypothetical protein HN680_02655 [Candidatus Peregrinibacteria bacterium]|jgi:acetyltransferase-like isoleucine patch superfamily enzyme|nr:hypothetical protein [Bacteroidota bacterium]MBT7483646.1 hypothetical protein [Candidatus Peregrinibacteria bacterium]